MTDYYGPLSKTINGFDYGAEHLTDSVCEEYYEQGAAQVAELPRHLVGDTFNPDRQRIIALDAALRFILITVRKDGIMVGHIAFTLSDSLQRMGLKSANEFSMFVDSEYRRHGIGTSLASFSVEYMRMLKLDVIEIGDKSVGGGASLEKMLSPLGFRPTDVAYRMNLGE